MLKKFLTLVVTTLLIACATPSTNYHQANQGELAAEKAHHERIFKNNNTAKSSKNKNYNLAKMKQRLNRVAGKITSGGQKLCKNMRTPPPSKNCYFRFELTKGNTINAYANGSKIFVSPGMMDFAKTDNELAVVLGHEYAHNLMAHVQSQTQNVMIGNAVGAGIDLLAQSQGINTGSLFGNLGAQTAILRYSSSFEREADYVGLYIMALAGYDVNTAANLWRRMSLQNKDAIYVETTHPTNPDRYIALQKTAQEITSKKNRGLPLTPNIKVKK